MTDFSSKDFDELIERNVSRTDFLALLAAGGLVAGSFPGAGLAQRTLTRSAIGSSQAKDTLIVAYAGDPPNLHPQFAQVPQGQEVIINTYDTVVDYPSGNRVYHGERYRQADYAHPMGGLVQSITRSRNGRVYTFTLRPNVRFPSGRKMTMRDVSKSFDAMFNANGVGVFLLAQGGVTKRSQIRTLDSRRFQINASSATPITLAVLGIWCLTFYDTQLLSTHATAGDPYANKWLVNHVAGYGAYILDKFSPGVELRLRANPSYVRGVPTIKNVVLKIVPSPQERASLLDSGAVDMATYLQPRDVDRLKKNSKLNVLSIPFIVRPYVGFNLKQKPFDNKLFRQALSYATPYDAIITSVYFGEARRCTSVTPLDFPGQYKGRWPYTYDLTKAKTLLAQSGVAKPSFDLVYDASFATHESIAIILRSEWAKIDVTANLKKLNSADFAAQWDPTKRTTPIWIEETFAVVPDPYYDLGLFFSDAGFHNFGHYHNTALEQAIKEGQFLQDTGRRLEIIRKAQASMVEDPPWIFLAQLNWIVPMRSTIAGYALYYDALTRYRLLKFTS